jgi:ectoine hydroxylase-related dioxygenase (phytanoyl-CoA dioxygenase family)
MPEPLLVHHYPTSPFVSAASSLSNPSSLRSLAEDLGYLFFEGFVPQQLLGPVRAFVRTFAVKAGWALEEEGENGSLLAKPGAILSGRGWDDPQWIELQRSVNMLPAFHELANHPALMDVLAVLYGEPAAPAETHIVWLKLPGSPEHTTRPHRDSFYLPTCPRMWTVWVPLTVTPMEVGPLAVVPGSHRASTLPQNDAAAGIEVPHDTCWVTQAVRPGDVVFFGAATIHCAWSNVSSTAVRLSLDVRYEPRSTRDSILRPGHSAPLL